MGVVRREGDWRLEKQEQGVYEVTYQEQPELKIITTDYNPQGMVDERADFATPVHEVESFSDAKSLFQEMAQDQSRGSGGVAQPLGGSIDVGSLDIEEVEDDLPDVPPVGALLLGLVVSGYLIAQSELVVDSPLFLIGGAFLLLPVVVLGLTYQVYSSEGVGAAIAYLFTVQEQTDEQPAGSEGNNDGTQRTPPAPEGLKNELYFERADRQCEWCGEKINSHDTHHIKSREEGGPNEPENLIILYPNCHREADRGTISRSKLRHQVSEQMEDWE